MSEQNQTPNPNEPKELSKEEKAVKLQELGVIGEDHSVITKLSHEQLDHLIDFNSNKVVETKETEQVEDEESETVPRTKWNDEVLKRRDAESKLTALKNQIKAAVGNLTEIVK